MEKLGNLVADHIADRLLQPDRVEEVLASVLDRRQESFASRSLTARSASSARRVLCFRH
jgi:hypothetical protein